jgi:pyruvate/2-oxoglutarate dehydrogenase complex dihydrolipoamide dehydrogenase (E3) component
MAELIKPEICVIGAGSGGLSAAITAAAQGAPVVLIEKEGLGGARRSTDVPSKALIAAARRAYEIATSTPFGVSAGHPAVDFARVREHMSEAVAALAPNDSKARLTGLGIRVIEGEARFINAHTVAVGDAATICARRFIIATGSAPALPSIPDLDATPYLTTDTIFDLTDLPQHLIVIGAGQTELELAQAFRRLGSAVTLLDEAAQPLQSEEPECVAVVLDQFEREGIVVRSGVSIARVSGVPGKIEVMLGADGHEATITGSHLLLATGRRPNVDGLELGKARVRCKPDRIVVNRAFRTRNRRVYAIGDVIGGPHFAHAASRHAELVVRHILNREKPDRGARDVPRVTFTDPELARTGMTEADVRRRRSSFHVLRWPYSENERAQAERVTRGHIKILTDGEGRILGTTIVGAGAGEMITTFTLAVRQGMKIQALAGIVMPSPTLVEIGKRAAATYLNLDLTTSLVQRIIAMLRRRR